MSKKKIKTPIKKPCFTCLSTNTYRECLMCFRGKCIMCLICKCQSINDSPTKNNKSVTKPIRKSKKRPVKK